MKISEKYCTHENLFPEELRGIMQNDLVYVEFKLLIQYGNISQQAEGVIQGHGHRIVVIL